MTTKENELSSTGSCWSFGSH
uniref:Uncharacterized protein n=1 Tax=Anguilla anguilla TaxID=7936 RepID=A0A0E9RUZ4_ANGAN